MDHHTGLDSQFGLAKGPPRQAAPFRALREFVGIGPLVLVG